MINSLYIQSKCIIITQITIGFNVFGPNNRNTLGPFDFMNETKIFSDCGSATTTLMNYFERKKIAEVESKYGSKPFPKMMKELLRDLEAVSVQPKPQLASAERTLRYLNGDVI